MPTERIERCCTCCARIPSASLFAFILLICGLGLLTGSLIAVGERLKTNDILNYGYFYELFKLIISGLAPCMVLIGIIFLIVSILLSGKTRRTLFWGTSRHLCAKILNSTVFFLCYMLFIIWFIITCALLYPLLLNVYYKFTDCKANARTPKCIDARLLILHSNVTRNGTQICDEKKFQLCNQFDEYLISFGISFIGSFVIMLSLLHFIISISSNHAYIKSDNPNYNQELALNSNGNAVNDSRMIEETKM